MGDLSIKKDDIKNVTVVNNAIKTAGTCGDTLRHGVPKPEKIGMSGRGHVPEARKDRNVVSGDMFRKPEGIGTCPRNSTVNRLPAKRLR